MDAVVTFFICWLLENINIKSRLTHIILGETAFMLGNEQWSLTKKIYNI